MRLDLRLNLVGPFTVNHPFGTEIAFSKGLRELGIYVTECDPNLGVMHLDYEADATIVFKSCCGREDQLKQLSGPVIVYQPDDARFPHIMGMMLMMRKYSDMFLSFDRHGATIAKNMGYRAAEELLLTADPELYSPSSDPPAPRDIDISFIGSLGDPVAHASRRKMCRIVEAEAAQRGWKFVYAQCQDIPTVLDIYRRSKVVLNHATDVGQKFGFGFGLQCRHFEVGMTKTCLLSNQRLGIDGPEKMQYVQFFDETSLIRQLEYLLEDRDHWTFHGTQLYEDIKLNHMPVHRAARIVDFIKRNAR